ncbi:hypothetical protein [Streptomyces sp. AC550_RSS872]|uniref:hypothetical protein n=1 Tax=Streptomyces sp. AC550_RSS872 TaxID=2823689 RepID=UPI001C25AD0A|nr:hypothetical protein [Streptomyces sp. AC550_RSS872]
MDHLTLIPDASGDEPPTSSSGWRFSVIPPKDVRARWYRKIKTFRRPAGTLALPAITATGSLHFTHTLHDSDTVMALGLTTLIVIYDGVIAICRTWQKTTVQPQHHTNTVRRAA